MSPPIEFLIEVRMTPKHFIDRLRSLRVEIGDLCIVKCHMSHERIIRVDESVPRLGNNLPEGSYERIGLCSPEVRAQRLGCSHTTARIGLEDAVDELKTGNGNSDGPWPLLSTELNWLNNQIHLLDHRKGEAEKTLARIEREADRAADRPQLSAKLSEAQGAVGDMERLHDRYVEQLGVLKDKVVNEMDRLIEQLDIGQRRGAERSQNQE